MRKNYYVFAIILTLIVSGCTGSNPTATIEKNYLIFNYSHFEIRFSAVGDEIIYVEAKTDETEYAQSSFFLNLDSSRELPIETNKGFFLGGYDILPKKSGFAILKDNRLLYESKYMVLDSKLVEKRLNGKELQYGMGHNSNNIIRSNEHLEIYHYPTYGHRTNMFIPFNFTSDGDSFYYNSFTSDSFDFGPKESGYTNISSNKGSISYYYFKEDTPQDSITKFYEISNSKSLLPKWAYGFIQSKYGYFNYYEVLKVVEEFELREIPISAIVLDLYWFKHMGDLDWDESKWNPEKLEDFLSERDIKLITISEPFISSSSKNFDVFSNAGILALDETGEVVKYKDWWCFSTPDGSIMNPIAANSYEEWGSFYSNMLDDGVDGLWMDLGEPENVPEHAYFNEYTEFEFHNYYNKAWIEMVYSRIMQTHPDKRPFLLNRSGYTGAPGMNVSHWSGDVPCTFSGLQDQITLALNDSFVGFSYWGSDIGGFVGTPDPELFLRWYQFGVWTPIFRAHGNRPREPWIFGDEITEMVTNTIVERYTILPYIYSTAWQTYAKGYPMMRPMFYETENIAAWELHDQYMFGDFFLVAPVLEDSAREIERSLYLPEDSVWYSWPELELAKEVGNVSVDTTDLSKTPVYIKEGAIVPLNRNNIETYLLIPSDVQSSYTVYSDDGETNDYLKGEYEELEILLNSNSVVFSGIVKNRMVSVEIMINGTIKKYDLQLKTGSVELIYQ